MNSQPPSSRPPARNLELVAAVTLGLLAVGFFLAQALLISPTTTPLETVLFNCLQFLLTVGFAWFSTRAVSRHEFEQSMKRYAISAYRRIADIERLVGKLHNEVRGMMRATRDDSNLAIIEAMVSDSEQVVKSSIADWADVIGDELLALERIKRLQREKVELKEEAPEDSKEVEYEAALKTLNEQIAQLRSSLPARLQFVSDSDDALTPADEHAAEWMARQHKRERGLRLTVVTGDQYIHDREFSSVKVGELLQTVKTEGGAFDVADESGNILGRLQNNSPLDYSDFVHTLENCFAASSLQLKVVRIIGSDIRDESFFGWFGVRVLSEAGEKRHRQRSTDVTKESESHDPHKDSA
jgi:hypothetical protein